MIIKIAQVCQLLVKWRPTQVAWGYRLGKENETNLNKDSALSIYCLAMMPPFEVQNKSKKNRKTRNRVLRVNYKNY